VLRNGTAAFVSEVAYQPTIL